MIVLIVVTILVLLWGVRQLEPRMAFFPFSGETVTPQQFGVEFAALTLDTADGERLRAWHLPRRGCARASRLLSRQRRQPVDLGGCARRPLAAAA
jgi:hypothetical protein